MDKFHLIYKAILCIVLITQPSQGAPPERPIEFTVRPGILHASNLRDLQNGWHPLLQIELHAIRRTWLGYIVELGLSRAQNTRNQKKTTRFLTTGLSFFHTYAQTRFEYRLQYGALLTGNRASTLFTHGLHATKTKNAWHIQVSIDHLIPNDWLSNIGLNERYGSFIFSLGGGISF